MQRETHEARSNMRSALADVSFPQSRDLRLTFSANHITEKILSTTETLAFTHMANGGGARLSHVAFEDE